MIQHEFHADQLLQSLALHRFNVHVEEVRRALTPILQEVYQLGYDCGVADNQSVVVSDVVVEYNPPTPDVTEEVHVEEEVVCEQSSPAPAESVENTSSES